MSLPTVAVPEGAPSPALLESTLTQYRGFRCIGVGAMGIVFEAHHAPLDRRVAVKVLSPSAAGAQTVERFFREARAMAKLSHPHIVPVYEVGGEGYLPYFTMELVNGGSLKELLQRKNALPPRQAASIARDIADGLAHAHDNGILHRDVKPGNVLIDEQGRARLTDFGLVRRTDSATLTATDAIVGTPQYMSPEQVRSEEMDGRSDQFSLGATLYEMLAGEPPFRGENPVSVLRAICELTPKSLRKLRREIPASLEAVVVRMLEKDPARRYPSLVTAKEDLERYLNGEAVEATLPGPLTRNWRRLRANRAAARFALAFVLVAAVAGFYLGRDFLNPEDPALRIQQAQNAFNAGDTAAAQRILEQELDPDLLNTPEVLSLRGNIANRQHDPGLALYYFRAWFEQAPGDPLALEMCLQACREIGDFERARRFLRQASQVADGQPERAAAAPRLAQLHLEFATVDRMSAEQCRSEFLRLNELAEAEDGELRSRLRVQAAAQQRRATKFVSDGRARVDAYEAELGPSDRSVLERFILKCLGAFLERNPALRAELLLELKNEAAALGSVMGFSEAGYYAREVMREIMASASIPEEVREEAEALQERYNLLYQTALAAAELAKGTVERSLQSMVAPSASSSVGPVGRARTAVTGLIDSVFGGD